MSLENVTTKQDADLALPVASELSRPVNHQNSLDFEPEFSTFRKKDVTVKLVWKDIEYSVGGTGKKKKVILKKISGEASPGEVVALMGVSSITPNQDAALRTYIITLENSLQVQGRRPCSMF
jgi:hypothetical protein